MRRTHPLQVVSEANKAGAEANKQTKRCLFKEQSMPQQLQPRWEHKRHEVRLLKKYQSDHQNHTGHVTGFGLDSKCNERA